MILVKLGRVFKYTRKRQEQHMLALPQWGDTHTARTHNPTITPPQRLTRAASPKVHVLRLALLAMAHTHVHTRAHIHTPPRPAFNAPYSPLAPHASCAVPHTQHTRRRAGACRNCHAAAHCHLLPRGHAAAAAAAQAACAWTLQDNNVINMAVVTDFVQAACAWIQLDSLRNRSCSAMT
eukprot:scaffold78581_cov21-Tisochrysis_lutea.AAC.1